MGPKQRLRQFANLGWKTVSYRDTKIREDRRAWLSLSKLSGGTTTELQKTSMAGNAIILGAPISPGGLARNLKGSTNHNTWLERRELAWS